jgi:hypothetical protein
MCCLQLCILQLFNVHLRQIEIFTDKVNPHYHLGFSYIHNKYHKIIIEVTYQKFLFSSSIISQPTNYASQ